MFVCKFRIAVGQRSRMVRIVVDGVGSRMQFREFMAGAKWQQRRSEIGCRVKPVLGQICQTTVDDRNQL